LLKRVPETTSVGSRDTDGRAGPDDDDHFFRQYGFWQLYVQQVIYQYLDCGDNHNGFAR